MFCIPNLSEDAFWVISGFGKPTLHARAITIGNWELTPVLINYLFLPPISPAWF